MLLVPVWIYPVVHLVDLAATTIHHNVFVIVPIVLLSRDGGAHDHADIVLSGLCRHIHLEAAIRIASHGLASVLAALQEGVKSTATPCSALVTAHRLILEAWVLELA